MALELTREAEQTFFDEESFHKLILEVDFADVPQPEIYREFCVGVALLEQWLRGRL